MRPINEYSIEGTIEIRGIASNTINSNERVIMTPAETACIWRRRDLSINNCFEKKKQTIIPPTSVPRPAINDKRSGRRDIFIPRNGSKNGKNTNKKS